VGRSQVPATPARSASDDTDDVPSGGLWQRMKADPQYAPEHLALEAVRRLGPGARDWVADTRARYPGIHPDQVAVLAVKRFTKHARLSGAVSGATGLPGAVVDVGVLAWTQSRMVLHVAAAYGVDPTHRDRAVDLLVLQKVHKIAETARLTLSVAAGRERASELFARSGQAPLGGVMLKLGVKLAQMAGVGAARKLFAKVVPGAAVILGTWANSSATTDLAQRAITLYHARFLATLPGPPGYPPGPPPPALPGHPPPGPPPRSLPRRWSRWQYCAESVGVPLFGGGIRC